MSVSSKILHEITINDDRFPNFKNFTFKEGLNLIVSECTQTSSQSQTNSHNGVGKSSLIDVIHFMFGTIPAKRSIFENEQLTDLKISMRVTLQNQIIQVTRQNTLSHDHKKIRFNPEIQMNKIDRRSRQQQLSIQSWHDQLNEKDWVSVWGNAFFGFQDNFDTSFKNVKIEYQDFYKYLMHYTIRREMTNGFTRDQWMSTTSINQKLILKNTAVFHFMNLNSKVLIEKLRRKNVKNDHNELIRDIKRSFPKLLKFDTDIKVKELKKLQQTFQIAYDNSKIASFDEFHQQDHTKLDQELLDIDTQIQTLSKRLAVIKKELEDFKIDGHDQFTLVTERELQELYQEFGIIFQDFKKIPKTFQDAQKFNQDISDNRTHIFELDKKNAQTEIKALQEKIKDLKSRKKVVLNNYPNKTYTQSLEKTALEKAQIKININEGQNFIERLTILESEKDKIDRSRTIDELISKEILLSDTLNRAKEILADLGQALYGQPIKLKIGSKNSDVTAELFHPKSSSKGVSNILTFCLDLTLMRLGADPDLRVMRPAFLIHDSHIFDTVDERQVANALEIAKIYADTYGYQHIITLNSNLYDTALREAKKSGIDLISCKNAQSFSDADEKGTLFGQIFN